MANSRFVVQLHEGKAGKNRLHVDLAPHITDDRDALIDSLVAKGATKVNVGQDESTVTWTVLADPEGTNSACCRPATADRPRAVACPQPAC